MQNNPQTPKQILISGASIAGPTLAYWLAKSGHKVTIVERAKGLRAGGYAVDIRGTALQVIERMDLTKTVNDQATHNSGVNFVNVAGKVIAGMDENAHNQDIEIMRGDLAQTLYDLTKPSTEYIWNDSITAINDGPDGVMVQFEKSAPRKFDMVIGADGQHSNTRQLVFGDEKQFSHSLGCYIAIYSVPNHLGLAGRELIFNVPGKTVAMYADSKDATEAKALFMFKSPELLYGRHDTTAQKQLLMNAFAAEKGWETQRLLSALPDTQDFYFDSLSQIRMEHWTKGNVALLGDAAYGPSPASGQGTSLALVGAYILAQQIGSNQTFQQAFANYQTSMRSLAEKNQKIGVMAANSMVEGSNAKLWFRNQTMHVPFLMNLMYNMVMKMIDKASNAIPLD